MSTGEPGARSCGWLWASARRAGAHGTPLLLATSVAFALWHVSAVVLPTGFDPPTARVPVFLANAAVIGAIWGMLRRISGSIVVSSVAHGLWNGLAYVLFGFGTRVGKLGIGNTGFYGPEVGVLGLFFNVLFAAALWRAAAASSESPLRDAIVRTDTG
jgi:CAAX protease family protein